MDESYKVTYYNGHGDEEYRHFQAKDIKEAKKKGKHYCKANGVEYVRTEKSDKF